MKAQPEELSPSNRKLAESEMKRYENVVARGKGGAAVRRRLEACLQELRRPVPPTKTAPT